MINNFKTETGNKNTVFKMFALWFGAELGSLNFVILKLGIFLFFNKAALQMKLRKFKYPSRCRLMYLILNVIRLCEKVFGKF